MKIMNQLTFKIPVFIAALIGVVMFFFSAPVYPHDATPTAAKPQGWNYPFQCCANYDCEQVKSTSIYEGPNYYSIRSTGELIPYSDKRIHMSPDGEFHLCAHKSGIDAGKTICLFVPPRGF